MHAEETPGVEDAANFAEVDAQHRQMIERAKDILIRQRNVAENEAYAMLNNMANKRNIKVEELCKQLVNVADILII